MGATRIDPGQETIVLLSFPMGMHAGMEGPHLFEVTVPVTSDGGTTGEIRLHFQAHFG